MRRVKRIGFRHSVLLSVLVIWLISFSSFAHTIRQTSLFFTQKDQRILLNAYIDPAALQAAFAKQNLTFTLSDSSAETLQNEIGLLFDEHLVISDGKKECYRDQTSMQMRFKQEDVLQIRSHYECERPPEALSIRCDLFLDALDAHPIVAAIALPEETVSFLFDQARPVFYAKQASKTKLPTSYIVLPENSGNDSRVLSILWQWGLPGVLLLLFLLGIVWFAKKSTRIF